MSLLVTPSLVNAIDWYNDAPPSWKGKAFEDLHNQLARISTPMSEAVQLGIRFENAVYNEVKNKTGKGSELFKWFVEQCKDGTFQKTTKQLLTIDGEEFCLYGKIDAWWPTHIIDIKTTSNYKGASKYLDTIQHQIYCLNEKISDFDYIIGVFDNEQKLIEHHTATYKVESFDDLLEEVKDRVRTAYRFIKSHLNLHELYTTTFSKRS